MNRLDEIAARVSELRADGAKAAMWRTDEVLSMVAALKAVEALAATWHQDYSDIDPRWSTDDIGFIRRDGRDDAAHEIESAIREALGS